MTLREAALHGVEAMRYMRAASQQLGKPDDYSEAIRTLEAAFPAGLRAEIVVTQAAPVEPAQHLGAYEKAVAAWCICPPSGEIVPDCPLALDHIEREGRR